ncbi:hypothetical protein [Dendronalium sp. ChiSLP03b]|uniref:hypothetical protein n=1 Tax=Dendronalium sp. ChiSLP03b TaxID=3075381 RepID=UPI002AD4FCD7|nr:hypothetical protein [Dendronalium sp. ChiSLP03b]MDZ8209050.1 hypothetical protein [Dendronalium sp. ChiSLP03b]
MSSGALALGICNFLEESEKAIAAIKIQQQQKTPALSTEVHLRSPLCRWEIPIPLSKNLS